MAKDMKLEVHSLPAGADLSAAQFLFVKLNSSGQVVLAGAGENAIGVLQNKPSAVGDAAEVALLSGGRYKVRAGGALATIGTKISSNASGQAAAAATGQHVLGVQLTTATAANQLVEVLAVSNMLLP